MENQQFRLLFRGEILDGFDPDKVRRNFAGLFKMDEAKSAHLFSGKSVVLRKNLSPAQAKKFQGAIRAVGADCKIEPMNPPAESASPAPPPSPRPAPVRETAEQPPPPAAPAPRPPATKIQPVDHVERGREISRMAYGQARQATHNAVYALKVLFTDPMGGQGEAYSFLGRAKALSAGVFFIVVFALAAFLVEYSLLSSLREFARAFGGASGISPIDYIKIMLLNFVPPAALCASLWGISKASGGDDDIHVCFFSTGVALIPSTITLLVLWIFGLANWELVTLVAFFGLSITLLLVNSALLHLHLISTRKAVLLTPTVVLLTLYIGKVLFAAFIR